LGSYAHGKKKGVAKAVVKGNAGTFTQTQGCQGGRVRQASYEKGKKIVGRSLLKGVHPLNPSRSTNQGKMKKVKKKKAGFFRVSRKGRSRGGGTDERLDNFNLRKKNQGGWEIWKQACRRSRGGGKRGWKSSLGKLLYIPGQGGSKETASAEKRGRGQLILCKSVCVLSL